MKKIILEQVDKLNVKEKSKYDAAIKSGFKITTVKEFNTDTSNYEYKSYGTGYSPAIQPVYLRKKKVSSSDSSGSSGNAGSSGSSGNDLHPKNQAEGDAFREWMGKTYSNFKCLSNTDTLSKEKGKPFKNACIKEAWGIYKTEFRNRTVSPGTSGTSGISGTAGTSGTNLTTQQQTIVKMKGCKSVGNKSLFRQLSQDNDELNSLLYDFINWWKNFTGKENFVKPSGKCGIFPEAPSMWMYGILYDENGDEYYPWQSSIVNDLLNTQTQTKEGETVTYYDLWVKNLQRRKDEYQKKLQGGIANAPGSTSVGGPGTNVTISKTDLERASEVVLGFTTRQTCKNLKGYLKGYNNSNQEVNKSIEKCKAEYPKLMKENLQDKITSKLIMMKENKQLTEKVSDKLKTKKLEKISENFFKQNYRKFFDSYSKHMKSNNMISEATNDEFSKSFDVIFKGKEEEFKKRAIDYIITKLEVNTTSPLATEIRNELSKKSAKELFTNEYDIPDAVTTAIEKTNQQNTSDETGLKGIVSKSVKIDDKQVKQEVRKHLEKYVADVKNNISSLEQKLKSSIIQSV